MGVRSGAIVSALMLGNSGMGWAEPAAADRQPMRPGLWNNAIRIDAVDSAGQTVQAPELLRADFQLPTCLSAEFLKDHPYLRADLASIKTTLERAKRKLVACSYHTAQHTPSELQLAADCETEERDGSQRKFEMRVYNHVSPAHAVVDLRLRPQESPEDAPFMRMTSEMSHLSDACTGRELSPKPVEAGKWALPPALHGAGMAPTLTAFGHPMVLGQISMAEWGLGNLYIEQQQTLADSATTVSVDWWPHTESLDRALALVHEQFQSRTFLDRPIELLVHTDPERISLKVIPMDDDASIALVGIDRFVKVPGVPGVVYVSLNTRVADGKTRLEGVLKEHLHRWTQTVQNIPLRLFDQTPPLGRWTR